MEEKGASINTPFFLHISYFAISLSGMGGQILNKKLKKEGGIILKSKTQKQFTFPFLKGVNFNAVKRKYKTYMM